MTTCQIDKQLGATHLATPITQEASLQSPGHKNNIESNVRQTPNLEHTALEVDNLNGYQEMKLSYYVRLINVNDISLEVVKQLEQR